MSARTPKALLILTQTVDDLRPFLGTSIVQLAAVGNRAILAHVLDGIRDAGIEEVGLVVSDATAEEVRAFVGDGAQWRLRCHYIEQSEPFGDAGALLAAEEFLARAPFLVHHGDGMVDLPLRRFIRRLMAERLDALLVKFGERAAPLSVASPPGTVGAAGRGAASDDVLAADLQEAGALVLRSNVFDVLRELGPSWRGTVDLADALLRLREGNARIERRSVAGWRCEGSPEDLLIGNRFVLTRMAAAQRREARSGLGPDAGVIADPTARIESSVIRGPSVIAHGASLVDCYIGPYTSIGPGVVVEGAEIEDSIVLAGATIRNLGRRLEASVVGRGAHVSRDFALPSVLRMRVGERAEVALA